MLGHYPLADVPLASIQDDDSQGSFDPYADLWTNPDLDVIWVIDINYAPQGES